MASPFLELFGMNQGVKQVDREASRDDESENNFAHFCLLKSGAEARIGGHACDDQGAEQGKDDFSHVLRLHPASIGGLGVSIPFCIQAKK